MQILGERIEAIQAARDMLAQQSEQQVTAPSGYIGHNYIVRAVLLGHSTQCRPFTHCRFALA